MRARAARDLGQLADEDFFPAVSEGLAHIIVNATRLHESMQTLIQARHAQGSRVLRFLAEEEAAKFLILLDAVRCPRHEKDMHARQLGYFSNHLARGIYAELASAKPVDLAELIRYADSAREKLYLDGPNGVDWIFRNHIEARREEAMYVDYVETDDGHRWLIPDDDELFLHFNFVPPVLKITQALSKTGLITPNGLAIVAKVWRSLNIHPAIQWDEIRATNRKTLEELAAAGCLAACADVYGIVIGEWRFPLYALDLSAKMIDRAELRARQASWSPDY